MRNIWIIAKREYNHYFISPIAYVVAFLILFTIGVLFAINIFAYTDAALRSFGFSQAPDATIVTSPFGFLLVLSLPAVTMRLLADEARTGTLELLLTAPVRDYELVVGKWLGSLLFMLTILAITLVYPIILNGIVKPGIDQRLVMSAYLGVILLMAAFLALGVGISAIFTNQVAAFFMTLSTFVFFWWLVGFPVQALQSVPNGASASAVFNYLSADTHFYNAFNAGRVYIYDIVYFLSLTFLGLFAGTTAIEIRRWR